MPRVNTAEGFLWRAAPQPQRVRLIGAIAIGLSCGALGVLVGRFTVERVPSEPGTRTAALIEAVAKETRAKLAVAAKEPAGKAPRESGPLRVAPVASSPPEGSSPATSSPDRLPSSSNAAVSPEPRATPAAPPEESASPPVPRATLPSGARQAERQRPPPVPAVPEVRRPRPRPAPQESTAPDYQALRDYVLSR